MGVQLNHCTSHMFHGTVAGPEGFVEMLGVSVSCDGRPSNSKHESLWFLAGNTSSTPHHSFPQKQELDGTRVMSHDPSCRHLVADLCLPFAHRGTRPPSNCWLLGTATTTHYV